MKTPVKAIQDAGWTLVRIIHRASAAADPGMSAALRAVGILASIPVCGASLRKLARKAGYQVSSSIIAARS